MHYKNLCKKTSFLATDATTQSSNQEENEGIFFFLFRCKTTQQGKMMTRSKPREKRKLWLKAQIANRIRAQKC
jgi:hypothetical protein